VKIAELLKEGLVATGFTARDKAEALPKLLDLVGDRLTPEHRAKVLDALLAREKVASTGLDNGIAMPHARVEIPGDVIVAMAVSTAGIPFQSADGRPSHILTLLVIPTAQQQKGVKLLADAARLLSYEEVREGLVRARTPREALEVLRSHES
jgi:PTS system fructose-specific IIC component